MNTKYVKGCAVIVLCNRRLHTPEWYGFVGPETTAQQTEEPCDRCVREGRRISEVD